MADIENRFTVVGVASFAAKPCTINTHKPSGFAKVASHVDWILDNSDAGQCQLDQHEQP